MKRLKLNDFHQLVETSDVIDILEDELVIECDEHRTLLKIYNPIQKQWFETSLIACGEVGTKEKV